MRSWEKKKKRDRKRESYGVVKKILQKINNMTMIKKGKEIKICHMQASRESLGTILRSISKHSEGRKYRSNWEKN